MEFHIDAGVDGGFIWRAFDADGVELVVAQPLPTREACVRTILTFKVEAAGAPTFDLVRSRQVRPPSPEPVPRRKATALVSIPRVPRRRTSRRRSSSA
jgi:hypothetical protein